MAPASGAGGIGRQVGPAAFDGSGLRAFAAPSTCMGPPLTESPGRCQVHERGRRVAEPIRASTTTRRAAHEWRPVLERMARRSARHQVPARLGLRLQRASRAPGAVAGGLQRSALRRGANVRDLGGHGQPGSGPGLKGQATTATPLRSIGAGHEGGPREPVVDARSRAASTGAAKTPDAIARDRRRLDGHVMWVQGGSVCAMPAGDVLRLGLTAARLASGGEPGIRRAGRDARLRALPQRRGDTRVQLRCHQWRRAAARCHRGATGVALGRYCSDSRARRFAALACRG
jgi:hypothetical protein